jgi:threonine/homoserine/homoserine lactone efflux protein
MNPELLWVFIPTIAAISLTPGMCMTLAFTLGLSQGYRRTLWMMWGELAGVATVVSTCVMLLAWIQSLSEVYFALLALVGGSYLLWIAYRLWTQPARFTGG